MEGPDADLWAEDDASGSDDEFDRQVQRHYQRHKQDSGTGAGRAERAQRPPAGAGRARGATAQRPASATLRPSERAHGSAARAGRTGAGGARERPVSAAVARDRDRAGGAYGTGGGSGAAPRDGRRRAQSARERTDDYDVIQRQVYADAHSVSTAGGSRPTSAGVTAAEGGRLYGTHVEEGSIAAQVRDAMLKEGKRNRPVSAMGVAAHLDADGQVHVGRLRPASAPLRRDQRPGSAMVERRSLDRYPSEAAAPVNYVSSKARLRAQSAKRRREEELFKRALMRDEKEQANAAKARITQANVWAQSLGLQRNYRAVELPPSERSIGKELRIVIMENNSQSRDVSIPMFNREYEKLKKQAKLQQLHDKAVAEATGGSPQKPPKPTHAPAAAARVRSPPPSLRRKNTFTSNLAASAFAGGGATKSPGGFAGFKSPFGKSGGGGGLGGGMGGTGHAARAAPKPHVMGPVIGNYSHTLVVPKAAARAKRPSRAQVQAELRSVLAETAELTEILQHQLDELRRKGWNRGAAVTKKAGVDYWAI